MQSSGFTRLVVALGRAFGNVSDLFGNVDDFQELLAGLGWSATDLPASYRALASSASALRTSVQALNNSSSYDDLLPIIDGIRQLVLAIEGLQDAPAGLNAANFLPVFKQQLLNVLLVTGIRNYLPAVYYLFKLLGIISTTSKLATTDHDAYQNETFQTAMLADLLQQPAETLGAQFGWGQGFTFGADMQQNVLGLLNAVGVNALLMSGSTAAASDDSGPADPNDPERNKLRLPFIQHLSSTLQEAMTITLDTATVATETDLLSVIDDEDLPDDGDVPLVVNTQDELSFNLLSHLPGSAPINLTSNLRLDLLVLQGLSNALTFVVSPDGLRFANAAGNALTTLALDPAVALTYTPDTPLVLMGQPGKTRLQVEGMQLALSLKASGSKRSVKLTLQAVKCQLIIDGREGDSFLNKVLPSTTVPVPLSISLSSDDGLRFNGINSLNIKAAPNLKIGPVLFESLSVGIASTPQYDLRINAHADVALKLGPVEVTASELGISFGIKKLTSPKDIIFGFDLPKGLGIFIKSDAVQGGGYLFLDPLNHKYAGAAQLSIKEKINLSAVGILQTRLPNNPNAYSFLLLITAEFSPIQLGLGFTLNGVGGLIGINRTANVDALRSLVQNGRTDTLLFPRSVLSNPQAAVATVDSAFPAAEGRYVFGIMAKMGWGTPNLLTLDAALIIELPAPVRLILLGILRATLPNESTAIVRLRADFIGIVDFGAKKISFDAVLVDSKILQFPLTGNFAFRLYQGDNPVFLMTAGGFHPAFQPPANADLPTMRRLTLALAQGGDLRLTLMTYLAITSNTVQFGSRLELFVDLPGPFTLEGFLGFDALFRFNPFYIEVRIGAGVAIKRGSRSVLSISLNLLVSGPAPWHIDGEGSFKILFFRVRFRVNRTFGGGTAQPALPTTDVRQLLAAALQDKGNWEVQQPPVKPTNTVVLRTEDQPTELVVDPGGALAVRQKVVPFDFPVEVYGNTRPTNGNRFDVAAVTLGSTTAGNADRLTGGALGEIREPFAPSQFRRMSDAEKLSAPSFQALRSGVRLNTVDGLKGHGGQTRRLAFEMRIEAPSTSSQQRPAAGSTTQTSAGDTTILTSTSTALPVENLARLARMGAVSKTRRSHEQRRPSRLAPDQVLWDEDSYAIVSVRNLRPEATAPNPFPTEAEATAYLQQRLASDPASAGELQVVPVYQLDVSAPAEAANLATV